MKQQQHAKTKEAHEPALGHITTGAHASASNGGS
jgi:hypothetical protein